MSHLFSPPSCPIPNTHTNVIENGDSNKAQFKLKIFSFINNSIVYLHCKLRICMETPGATCKIVGVECSKFLTGSSLPLVMRRVAVLTKAQGVGGSEKRCWALQVWPLKGGKWHFNSKQPLGEDQLSWVSL